MSESIKQGCWLFVVGFVLAVVFRYAPVGSWLQVGLAGGCLLALTVAFLRYLYDRDRIMLSLLSTLVISIAIGARLFNAAIPVAMALGALEMLTGREAPPWVQDFLKAAVGAGSSDVGMVVMLLMAALLCALLWQRQRVAAEPPPSPPLAPAPATQGGTHDDPTRSDRHRAGVVVVPSTGARRGLPLLLVVFLLVCTFALTYVATGIKAPFVGMDVTLRSKVIEELPHLTHLPFIEAATAKGNEPLPAGVSVAEVTTVFFQGPDVQVEGNRRSGFLKLQAVTFNAGASGEACFRFRSQQSDGRYVPTKVYHWARGGVLEGNVEPDPSDGAVYRARLTGDKDMLVVVATYDGDLVGATATAAWSPKGYVSGPRRFRDWLLVELSDLAGSDGVESVFAAGSASDQLTFARTYSFWSAYKTVWFSARSPVAHPDIARHLDARFSHVLNRAQQDFVQEPFAEALRFLADPNRGFGSVKWATDRVERQELDMAYITERTE